MQQMVIPYVGTRTDLICKAGTGTGKSTVYHMMVHPWISQGESSVYIGIMKALAAEKMDDWANPLHPWSRINKALLTGDTVDDPTRQASLERAQLICATPEAMLSKVWKHKSKDNAWVHRISSICMDEIHLSGQEGRGTQMEVLVKEMTRINPNIQVICLSGTLPNIDDFVEWMTRLKGRQPVVIDSDFRPVEIERHYHPVLEDRTYQSFDKIEQILTESDPKKQYMIAVWNKAYGRRLTAHLKDLGHDVEFHNGDRSRSDRQNIEARFRARNLRVLVSTSTLFTGVNLPADGIIIPTPYWRGGDDIPYTDLGQALGRAGRVGLSDKGEQHVCIPAVPRSPEWIRQVHRINNGEPIISQMQLPHSLATHFLGAVSCGAVEDLETLSRWFDTTLWAVQGPKIHKSQWDPRKLCEVTAQNMAVMRMLKKEEHEAGRYELTTAGRIAAQMLLDPYHWSDFIQNVSKVAALERASYYDWAKAYACCREFRMDYDDPSELREGARAGLIGPTGYARALSVLLHKSQGRPVHEGALSTAFALEQQMERWFAALIRLKREALFFKGLDLRAGCAFCLRVQKMMNQDAAAAELDLLTDPEIEGLMGVGIFGLDAARAKPSLAAKALSDSRRAELRIRTGMSQGMSSLLNPSVSSGGAPTRPSPAPPGVNSSFMKLFQGGKNG